MLLFHKNAELSECLDNTGRKKETAVTYADLRFDVPLYSGLLRGQTHVLVHLSLLILIQRRVIPLTLTHPYSHNPDLARTC